MKKSCVFVKLHVTVDCLFDQKGLTKDQERSIVDFLQDNQAKMREISLRMAQKLADLCKMSPTRWQRLAETTCMKRI